MANAEANHDLVFFFSFLSLSLVFCFRFISRCFVNELDEQKNPEKPFYELNDDPRHEHKTRAYSHPIKT